MSAAGSPSAAAAVGGGPRSVAPLSPPPRASVEWAAQLAGLAGRLGLRSPAPLLARALTHPSFAHENPAAGGHYERLEFLGDAALGLLASEVLSARWPAADEGELSRRRAAVVCRPALAEVAVRLGLGRCLRRGRGEPAPGPRVLAAAAEAVAGVLYLDGGMAAVARAFAAPMLAADAVGGRGGAGDAKTRLQERCHAAGLSAPRYRLAATDGPPHAVHFLVEVEVGGRPMGRACGRRKKDAEQMCAELALGGLDEAHPPPDGPGGPEGA